MKCSVVVYSCDVDLIALGREEVAGQCGSIRDSLLEIGSDAVP